MHGVVGQIVASFRMQQHDQIIAIEHQPRHKGREHLGGKRDLKHRVGMRSDQFVVPAAEFRFRKLFGDPLTQALGAAAARRRIVIDLA
jgi:hypothetical protein